MQDNFSNQTFYCAFCEIAQTIASLVLAARLHGLRHLDVILGGAPRKDFCFLDAYKKWAWALQSRTQAESSPESLLITVMVFDTTQKYKLHMFKNKSTSVQECQRLTSGAVPPWRQDSVCTAKSFNWFQSAYTNWVVSLCHFRNVNRTSLVFLVNVL